MKKGIEEKMNNGPKGEGGESSGGYNFDVFINKEKKLKQFDNTLNFYLKLKKTCLKLKTIKPDSNAIANNISLSPEALLKRTRKKYLIERIKSFNEDIVKTFVENKVFNPYVGIILPFETKNKS